MPDPLLHFHVVAFNATYDSVEERWKALDLGPVWLDATYYEALFSAKLAARMRALGYIVAPTVGQAWTIAGITPEMLSSVSRRATQVEERGREEEKKAKKA